MANTAISALPTVTTPLAGTEVLPIVQSNTTKRVTLAQIASFATYSLPTASASVLGGIKIGSGLSIDGNGVVSASVTSSYTLPTASDTVLGGIKVGTGLSIDGSSVLSSTITQYTDASARAAISVSGSLSYNSSTGVISYTTPTAYSLPIATTSVLGGVKQGTNTTIAADGTISVATGAGYSYTLPVASDTVLGGVKQGTNITIDANGVISASGASASATTTISNKTSAYTVVAGDLATIINCTSGTFTVSLTAAATLGTGFTVTIWNTSSTTADTITIDPNGSETIDGSVTLSLRRGEGLQIICDGTNWQTGSKKAMRAYAENYTTGSPPTVSGGNAIAIGNGTASGSASLAIGLGAPLASGNYSTAIGLNSGAGGSQAVTSAGAMALGGSYASGTDSFAAAVANNTSTYGAQSANSVAIGGFSKSTSTRSVAIGYYANASAVGSVAIGGYAYGAQTNSTYSIAIGDGATVNTTALGAVAIGWGNTINSGGDSSLALGCDNQGNSVSGKLTWGPNKTPGSGVPTGNPKYGVTVLSYLTTTGLAAVLTVPSSAGNDSPSNTNQIILPNNSAFAFTGAIIARQKTSDGNNFAAWEIKGGIVRGVTASTTSLGTYNINVLSKSAGAVTWTIALSADTTNGGLAITVTGAAAVNIRWVATVQTSEVTYA